MNLFGKKKPDNWLIKLFRITDHKIAKEFNMEECIINTINYLEQEFVLKPTDFGINFQITGKSVNGFKKALKRQKEIVYAYVGFEASKTNTFFTIKNPMLNWNDKPENSSIDITIQISSELIKLDLVEQIAESIISNYYFEYGYCTKLPSNYDSVTERKTKKGLFSSTVEVNEVDHAWTFHKIGIVKGFIKQLYPINYLNESHLSDLRIREVILNKGILKGINDKIQKWTLNSEELKDLKNNKQIERISIITADLGFLKTEDANKFKSKMELKKSQLLIE